MTIYNYSKVDIVNCFNKLNIKKNDILYITGDLANFGNIKIENIKDLTNIFFKIIKKRLDLMEL